MCGRDKGCKATGGIGHGFSRIRATGCRRALMIPAVVGSQSPNCQGRVGALTRNPQNCVQRTHCPRYHDLRRDAYRLTNNVELETKSLHPRLNSLVAPTRHVILEVDLVAEVHLGGQRLEDEAALAPVRDREPRDRVRDRTPGQGGPRGRDRGSRWTVLDLPIKTAGPKERGVKRVLPVRRHDHLHLTRKTPRGSYAHSEAPERSKACCLPDGKDARSARGDRRSSKRTRETYGAVSAVIWVNP
eukprot:gene204-biopygen14